MSISAPLTDRRAFEARLDFVHWFERDPLVRDRVRETLKRLPDVERALGRLAAGRGGPRDLGQLRAGLEGAAELKARLAGMTDRPPLLDATLARFGRSEEHTSELQSLMRISYAVFCLKKKKTIHK